MNGTLLSFERVAPEEVGIHSRGIIDFIEECDRQGLELHSLMVLRHGKVCAEGWWRPYAPDTPQIVFSFSKAFTSTAVGFAVQEGLLSLQDRILSFFPEYAPASPSENLKKATVRDLLTMTCGHAKEIDTFGPEDSSWIKAFFAQEFVYEPGTTFLYNTAGTDLLCAILKKVSGQDLTDFLTPRLFEPLGIRTPESFRLSDGTQMGGAGLRVTAEDMARFIWFIHEKGRVGGKQLLDPSWIEAASAKQGETISPATPKSTPDWNLGYGYQFWRCVPPHTFRGDGAFGQYGIVFEDLDTVFILQSASWEQQAQLTACWKTFLPAVTDSEQLPPSPDAERLREILANAELKTPLSFHNNDAELLYSGVRFEIEWGRTAGGADASPRSKCDGTGEAEGIEEFLGSSRDFLGCGRLGQPSHGELRTVSLDFSDRSEAVLSLEAADREGKPLSLSLPIGTDSHFHSFKALSMNWGAVGGWRSAHRFEFQVRCAESVMGREFIFTFDGDTLRIISEPTLPCEGGLCGDGLKEYTARRIG